MKTGSCSPSAARREEVATPRPSGGCHRTAAVDVVFDMRDGEVRFFAHGLAARCDRVQARRQRTQGGDQLFAGPGAGIRAQQVDHLLFGQQPGECRRRCRVPAGR